MSRQIRRWEFTAFALAALAAISGTDARAQAPESRPHLSAQEMLLYRDAQSLIDWTPEQIRARRELRGLQLAESQEELPAILDEVEKRVARFFDDFPNTTCREDVVSELCWAAGRECGVVFESEFRYLLLASPAEGAQVLTEYRTDAKGRPLDFRRLEPGQILTSGFVGAGLQPFVPQVREACRFRNFGQQSVDGKDADVVGFAEIPEKYPHPIHFGQENGVVLLFVQGLAWIDATTHQILRVQTFLLAPRLDVSLGNLVTSIEFRPTRLAERSGTLWLPAKVVVDAWFRHQHYRNTHRYSHYKLFRVESRIGPVMDE